MSLRIIIIKDKKLLLALTNNIGVIVLTILFSNKVSGVPEFP
jgi:hypothetical protein